MSAELGSPYIRPGKRVPELQVRDIDPRISDYARLLARGINDLKPPHSNGESQFAMSMMDGTTIHVGWHNNGKGKQVYGVRVGEGDYHNSIITNPKATALADVEAVRAIRERRAQTASPIEETVSV